MRHLILGLLFALGIAGAQAGCVSAPQAEDIRQASVKFPPRDRGLLWRVEKSGRTSWLYGTIHVGRLEWLAPGPTIVRAMRASDAVALEIDLSDPEEIRAMTPPVDPASADRVLAGGLGARLQAQMRMACMPEAVATLLRPSMQAVALTAATARADGLHPELGIDFVLNGMARSLGKPVVALESVRQQLAILVPASEDEEREIVRDVLDELESKRSEAILTRMAKAWERGDEKEIATYLAWCDCVKTSSERQMLHRMLDDRNPAMAKKLAAIHDGGKTFFAAVGTLHMTGEQSLALLLRQRGFAVQSVPLGGATN